MLAPPTTQEGTDHVADRDKLNRWLGGVPFSELGDGAEVEVRGQVRDMVDLFATGKALAMEALEAGMDSWDGRAEHEWERFYREGYVQGKAFSANVIGHLFNRVSVWMFGEEG